MTAHLIQAADIFFKHDGPMPIIEINTPISTDLPSFYFYKSVKTPSKKKKKSL